MVTAAYRQWDSRGRKWDACKPVDELQRWAKSNKVKVLGTIGNDAHLRSDRPMDHTPFSSTEWPHAVGDPVVFAIDLANVKRDGVTLGEAIERQARAGKLPWLKYMNHGGKHLDSRDLDGDGKRWEEYDSRDEHVHLSVRTDWRNRSIGDFDPWTVEPGSEDFDMASVADVWRTDGLVKAPASRQDKKNTHWSPASMLEDIANHAREAAADAATAKTQAAAAATSVKAVNDRLGKIEQALATLVTNQAAAASKG